MVKHVVILGAGVAGLHCAQKLAKEAPPDLRITLVDSSDVHVLRADLYEVATAFNKEITDECMVRLKSTVATPILSLVDPDRVQFVRDEVTAIDPKKKIVALKKGKKLSFDFLVVTMGSVTNFFKVPGIEKHAFPFKSVTDALAINCHLDQLFHSVWKSKKNRSIHLTIGGGGATGCELAGELSFSIKKLCKKYHFPSAKVHIDLVQSGQDLGGMDSKGTEKIFKRLSSLGVCIYRGYRITKLTHEKVVLLDSKKKLKTLRSDMLIWTAGVSIHHTIQSSLGDAKKGDAIVVTPTLEAQNYSGIFAAGDNAYLENPHKPGERIPMLARPAWKEGNLIAENLVRLLKGRSLGEFKPFAREWVILPLGGKYALLQYGPFLIAGFLPWLLRRLIILRYHFSTMSLRRAFKKWRMGGEIFEEND